MVVLDGGKNYIEAFHYGENSFKKHTEMLNNENIKYKKISSSTKFYMLSLLLLSPTIRTLLIWPYPILWALCFFIVAVYFYLSFTVGRFHID